MPAPARSNFTKTVAQVVHALASVYAVSVAVLVVLVWAGAGPFLGYSQGWQMAINTTTTIVTFLMTFFILHAQGQTEAALHAKLDEVLRAIPDADDQDLAESERPDVDTQAAIQAAKARHASRAPTDR